MTECQYTYLIRGSKKTSTFSLETLKTEQCAITCGKVLCSAVSWWLVNSNHVLLLLLKMSRARQALLRINFKKFGIRSFKPVEESFATLILFWILQVCCGICLPMTSWSTCWLKKPYIPWQKLFSSLALAGQIEITPSQVFYPTLISSTMPQDAWGEHSVHKYLK